MRWLTDLVQRLDSALESPNAKAIVEDVARATEDLAGQGKWEDVVQVLERVHEHYAGLHDGDVSPGVPDGPPAPAAAGDPERDYEV